MLKDCVQTKELISVLREKLQHILGEKFIDGTNFYFNLRSSLRPLPIPRSPPCSDAFIKASKSGCMKSGRSTCGLIVNNSIMV